LIINSKLKNSAISLRRIEPILHKKNEKGTEYLWKMDKRIIHEREGFSSVKSKQLN